MDGNLKAADGTSDYVIVAAVGGEPGHIATLSLTIMFNGVPVGRCALRCDRTSPAVGETAGIVDIDVLYLQGKIQPATPEQLASLVSLIAQGNTALLTLQAVGGISAEELQARLDAIANGAS